MPLPSVAKKSFKIEESIRPQSQFTHKTVNSKVNSPIKPSTYWFLLRSKVAPPSRSACAQRACPCRASPRRALQKDVLKIRFSQVNSHARPSTYKACAPAEHGENVVQNALPHSQFTHKTVNLLFSMPCAPTERCVKTLLKFVSARSIHPQNRHLNERVPLPSVAKRYL